jgi:hypothetical protein
VSKPDFIGLIDVHENGKGFVAILDEAIFREVKPSVHFLQINEVGVNRCPNQNGYILWP